MKAAPRAALFGILVLAAGTGIATARESEDEVALREHWQQTFAQVRNDLSEAKMRLNEARVAYQNMRHRRRARGDEKQQIIDALRVAEAELPRAKTAFDAAKIAARRAGVPPGWIRTDPQAALPASATH